MKSCTLLLGLLCSIYLAKCQSSPSTWYVSEMTLIPELEYYYESCWPNGTVTISSNTSGTTFTVTQWTGPACIEYGLYNPASLFIQNGSEYGYMNANQSVHFNYQIYGSQEMVINLWYGCNGASSSCDTTATISLSSTNPNPACEIYIGSVLFNLCQMNYPFFNVTAPFIGTLLLSAGENIVTNCARTQNIFGTIYDMVGNCVDAFLEPPTATLADPNNPLTGGLILNYSHTSNKIYQTSFLIGCQSEYMYWSLTNMTFSESLESWTLSWGSPVGCGQDTQCSPLVFGNAVYNLCNLPSTVFNASLGFGGQVSVTLGQNASLSCPQSTENSTWALYYDGTGNCHQIGNSSASFIPLSDPKQGLQTTLTSSQCAYSTMCAVNVILLCKPDQSPSDIGLSFTDAVVQNPGTVTVYITLTGYSPYACPVNSPEILVA